MTGTARRRLSAAGGFLFVQGNFHVQNADGADCGERNGALQRRLKAVDAGRLQRFNQRGREEALLVFKQRGKILFRAVCIQNRGSCECLVQRAVPASAVGDLRVQLGRVFRVLP